MVCKIMVGLNILLACISERYLLKTNTPVDIFAKCINCISKFQLLLILKSLSLN